MQDVTAPPDWSAPAHQAMADMRRLLCDLGADADLLRRVNVRTDMGGREHLYVPPLPLDVAARLVRLLPTGAVS